MPNKGSKFGREMAETASDISSASNEEEGDVQEVNNTNNSSPWPFLDKFMALTNTAAKKFVFRCLLCMPKNKLLST